MDFSLIWQDLDYLLYGAYPNGPLGGAALTLLISIVAGIAATVLGTILGTILVMFRGKLITLLTLLLGFFRAIPVIMLIFWIYFLLPLLFKIDAPAVSAVIVALALIYASYLAHAVRAGILALGKGQWQAGLSLGLTRWQVLRMIILPQALRMMVPSLINQWVSLIKDSSLAYIINVTELTYLASQINGESYGVYSAEIFIVIGMAYFIFCMSVDVVANGVNWLLKPNHKGA